MDKYRVIYIDEEEKDRENYSEFLRNDKLEVITVHPNVVEDDLIRYIVAENFDCVVVDFTLYGKDPTIKYNGAEVIDQLHQLKDQLPAFILTRNKETDHVDELVMPYLIFTKSEIEQEPQRIQEIIYGAIKLYNRSNDKLSKRLYDLLEKREKQGQLNDRDYEELLDLNRDIEKRLNKKDILPDMIKDPDNLKALKSVLQDARNFLDSIKKK